jgi:hypothetical protein
MLAAPPTRARRGAVQVLVDENLRLYTASDDATICVWDIKAEHRVADRDKCLHTFRLAPRPASPGVGGSNDS